MQQVDYLYRKEGAARVESEGKVYCAVPFSRTCLLGYIPGEKVDLRALLARAWFKLITKGDLRIYYTTAPNGTVTHTSYVIGKCFKFPFMNKGDYEIGPCYTYPQHRGQGIYPMVLNYITQAQGQACVFYMLVKPANKSSIRGIEKAGFTCVGQTCKTKCKRYVKIK